jgi:hypothetical protein
MAKLAKKPRRPVGASSVVSAEAPAVFSACREALHEPEQHQQRRRPDVVAAVNVSLQTHRAPAEAIEKTIVPLLQDAARQIGHDYGGRATESHTTSTRG